MHGDPRQPPKRKLTRSGIGCIVIWILLFLLGAIVSVATHDDKISPRAFSGAAGERAWKTGAGAGAYSEIWRL